MMWAAPATRNVEVLTGRLSKLAETQAKVQGTNSGNGLTALTERERQIMRLVSEGLSNKEIGRRLSIADGTIKVRLHNIFQKLEISNRTVLAAIAISQHDRATAAREKAPHPGLSPTSGQR
ncbi:LuxR C-terminal-related transcriptional regulator [Bradyrhizobium sp. SSUT18]|uniref:response regulator transcription factor n=1 Tax=Bradyrhizobium sp. SSUT18 TaxID=3040602 RepID=UPI00244D35C4|nr:LuxR C-terminal-related transcriptional regulator [Bradyrhizobium sp. SSUT18]MDH2403146.1 LuxR C-terminal-related transcriptional regulator [Bradyrhizobium sp. SSUT18]